MVIYKYELSCKVLMPLGAKILSIQTQNGKAQIWALVDENQIEKTLRLFNIYETGQIFELSEKMSYIGTFQINNGMFIYHIYEITN